MYKFHHYVLSFEAFYNVGGKSKFCRIMERWKPKDRAEAGIKRERKSRELLATIIEKGNKPMHMGKTTACTLTGFHSWKCL